MSIRAGIFRKILHYIDKSDWRDYGEFIVFGEEAFQAMGTHNHMEEERQDKRVSEEIDRIVAEVARQQGSSLAAERTSMDGPRPLDLSILLKGCSPETLTAFQNARERMLRDQKAVSTRTVERDPNAGPLDELDGYYAAEVISKLERIVRLASALDAVEAERPPAPAVGEYFKEVHNCLLYDFPIACAVLCRALLEAGLKERLEPEKKRRHRKPSNQLDAWSRAKSDILRRLDQAEAKGVLDGSRVEAGEKVKDAGDAAIHRPEEFRKRWNRDDDLSLLVDETRKVLEDLHRATSAT
jgi:hypothetical protein